MNTNEEINKAYEDFFEAYTGKKLEDNEEFVYEVIQKFAKINNFNLDQKLTLIDLVKICVSFHQTEIINKTNNEINEVLKISQAKIPLPTNVKVYLKIT